VDKNQMQGSFSKPTGFTVRVDRTPPFLSVESPAGDTMVFRGSMEVSGRAEIGTAVTVGQDVVRVLKGGAFKHSLTLSPGAQRITVAAVDSAGNRSEIVRKVDCRAGQELFFLDGPEDIVSNADHVMITGRVRPGVRIWVDGRPAETAGGLFTVPLAPAEGTREIVIRASAPTGESQTKTVRLTVDRTVPDVQFLELPAYTEQDSIRLEGKVSETAACSINGRPVPVSDNLFSWTGALREGANPLTVLLKDHAGNTAEKVFTVVRDTEAPRVASTALSETRVRGGEIVNLVVRASDRGVGLARTATFTVRLDPGELQVSGLLKWNPLANAYEGSVPIPPGQAGTLALKQLYVSDYLGNTSSLQ
jgi:hypothetical protein